MNPTPPPPAGPAAPAPGGRGPLAGFGPVFGWGLARGLGPRALLLAAGLALGLGALVRVLVTAGGRTTEPARLALDLFLALDEQVLQYLVPITVLILAGGGYAREVRDRTLVYHLVRPVARRTVFLARFASGWVAAGLVTWLLLAAACAFSPVALPAGAYLALGGVAFGAALALGAVFYALAALFRHGLLAGLVYTFLFEFLFANVPGSMQRLSLRYHLRGLHHGLTDAYFAPLNPQIARLMARGGRPEALSMGDRGGEDLGLLALAHVPFPGPLDAALTLGAVAGLLLAAGCVIVGRRDYPLKD